MTVYVSLDEQSQNDLLTLFESKEFNNNIKDIKKTSSGFSYKIQKGCTCSNISICYASCCENVKKFVTKFNEAISKFFTEHNIPLNTNLSALFIRCDSIDPNFFDTCKDNQDDLKQKALTFAELIGVELGYFNLFKNVDDGSDTVSNFFKEGGSHSRRKRRAGKSSKKSRKSRRHRRSSHNKKRHTKRHTKQYRNRK